MSNIAKLFLKNNSILITKFNSFQINSNVKFKINISLLKNYTSIQKCCNKLIKKNNLVIQLNSVRLFKTTEPKCSPTLFWFLIRPVINFFAIFTGRKIRKWWIKLPKDKKKQILIKIYQNKKLILLLFAIFISAILTYYYNHIEETPITKRKRFLAISKERYNELANIQFQTQLLLYQNELLPNSHPYSKRIDKIAKRIIKSNLDIPEFRSKEWCTTVVYNPNIKNAFVLPNGQIFVFSGMLDLCENDDTLGVILSHEMAHSVLSHGAEILSYGEFIDFFVFFILLFIWTVLPTNILAALGHYFVNKIVYILFNLPYSRALEMEADKIGIAFAAKACFDVREGVTFWKKMDFFENIFNLDSNEKKIEIDYLSTHPSHKNRAEYIESLLPAALEIRKNCNCPKLPWIDPREKLKFQIDLQKKLNNNSNFINLIKII